MYPKIFKVASYNFTFLLWNCKKRCSILLYYVTYKSYNFFFTVIRFSDIMPADTVSKYILGESA